ncbi:response regulator [Sphingomonas sp. RB3P16]|uniref:response regulator n=1 Tax=Parasphingomonas frigoris TaxID=3096163 RepID=UPI002FC7CFB3
MNPEMQQRADSNAAMPLILVVDDEVLIRMVASDMLHEAGFRVVEACSADEAVTLLSTGANFDLIFSDVNMPGRIDGLGLAAFIKETYPDVPVIITSGVPENLLAPVHPAAIIPKPYTASDLIRTIGQVLDRWHD